MSLSSWIVIKMLFFGAYFDMCFSTEHPGGEEILLSATGRDATQDFENIHHTPDALKMTEEFCIGTLDPSTTPKGERAQKSVSALTKGAPPQDSGNTVYIAIFIIVIALIAAKFLL